MCIRDRRRVHGEINNLLRRDHHQQLVVRFPIVQMMDVEQLTMITKMNSVEVLSSPSNSFAYSLTPTTLLPTIQNSENPDIQTITADTLNRLLSPEWQDKFRVLIIDCRFTYEHKGGHIKGAINIRKPNELERLFISKPENLMSEDYLDFIRTTGDIENKEGKIFTIPTNSLDIPNIIIFHCEFSQKRGPKMYRHLRKLDRQNNEYPNLTYPDIYLLEGGYNKFSGSFPLSCGPYISMYDRDYEESCEVEEKEVSDAWRTIEKASKYGGLSVSSRRQYSL
eukprot:TRINITY_DN13326_c0_g1_i1.p1 TRINITY_DN13326_c0_g1~~TRINITY_DN13326_c0_g1_i1.p1  ORF type:complete len:280 (+),score=66.78 TRINITY_DN13326_c0_g1_i1:65-904(+)